MSDRETPPPGAPIPAPSPLAPGERGTPFSPVDVAWLRMDEPSNLMHIHGVLALDGEVKRDAAAARIGERLGRIPRFRQRVALDGGKYVWVDDPSFDLARHVVEERLPGPGGDRELAAAIAAQTGRAFDRRHPLWEFRIFQGYRGTDTVVLARIHHSIGDGVALMMVLLALTDLSASGPPTVETGTSTEGRIVNPFLELLDAGSTAMFEAARAMAEKVMPETLRLMLSPVEAFRRAGALARGAGSTAALGRLVARSSDPESPFKGKLTVEKRVAWTAPIPLDEIRSLAKALGGTLNDVLNAAMAGGLRRYLARSGEPPRDLAFRAAMPVNLRPLEEMAAMGNRFGLVFLDLPVGIADPRARFDAMRRASLALRRTAEPLVVHGLLSFAGRSPMALQRLLVAIFGSKATAVFTNVPGPRSRLFFAGRPLSDIYFWVPQAGRLGLGVSIFSYAGIVRMGVGTDAGLVPDPERIVDGFAAELDALAAGAARA